MDWFNYFKRIVLSESKFLRRSAQSVKVIMVLYILNILKMTFIN